MLEAFKEKLIAEKKLTLKVKVHAGARETRIKSILSDDTIKVDIKKIPEAGIANDELITFLATELGVTPHNITITRGKFGSAKELIIVTE